MTKMQKSFLEGKINEMWALIDKYEETARARSFAFDETGAQEMYDKVDKLIYRIQGMKMVLDTMGYHVIADVKQGKRRIVTDAQWTKAVS